VEPATRSVPAVQLMTVHPCPQGSAATRADRAGPRRQLYSRARLAVDEPARSAAGAVAEISHVVTNTHRRRLWQ
jgi:hypothetical protein